MSSLRVVVAAVASVAAASVAAAQPAADADAQDPAGAAPAAAPRAPVDVPPPTLTDVSARFPRGPFSALTTAPGDPARVAVGTEGGVVGWTVDGELDVEVASADVLIFRKMDPVTLRGTGGYASAGVAAGATASAGGPGGDAPRPTSASRNRTSRHVRDAGEGGENDEVRSLHQFLGLLYRGLPAGRWHTWMSISDPQTIVSNLALPAGGGPMALATAAGIYVSDGSRGSWLRALGAPGVMPRERDPIGLSVGIDPRDPRRVLAATDGGLHVSDDGGQTFLPHRDRALTGAWIHRIAWDPNNPDLVFLVAADQIFLSQDGGEKFEPSFAAAGEIRDLALSAEAAIVSTSEGLYLAYADRLDRALEGKDVVGAVAWRGAVLAATAEDLFLVRPGAPPTRLRSTTPRDPFLRMAGGDSVAWLLSRDTVIRIDDAPRRPPARRRPPRLLLSATEAERAVVAHTGLGGPQDVRMHGRWYAKLLPSVDLSVEGRLAGDDSTTYDGLFLLGPRHLRAGARDRIGWTVWLSWDLSDVLFGDSNTVNPNLMLETNLREKRKMILEHVQRTYREAAQLAATLDGRRADDPADLLEQLRLAELGSYLEFMSGRPILGDLDLE